MTPETEETVSPAPSPKRYKGPVYIVCEGEGDCAFLSELIRHHGLLGFEVGCPVGGKSGLEKHLNGVMGSTDASNIETLLVIFDNDEDPSRAVNAVRAAISAVGYEAPAPPGILAADRKAAIYMIPAPGVPGTLEHLLLRAVFDAQPRLERCIDEFCACTFHPTQWPGNTQAKMKLQALVAAHCKDNPGTPLRWVWKPDRVWAGGTNLIPIGSDGFKGLVEFLRQFALPAPDRAVAPLAEPPEAS
jgi:hypothetical protein